MSNEERAERLFGELNDLEMDVRVLENEQEEFKTTFFACKRVPLKFKNGIETYYEDEIYRVNERIREVRSVLDDWGYAV